MRRPSEATWARAAGTVLAFVIVGLLVKYSQLLFTFEHRQYIEPQGTMSSRVLQIWMSLRFSWQELTSGAVLLALVALGQRLRPSPGPLWRAAVATLRVPVAFLSVVSVFGIAYYAVYHTQFSAGDLAYAGFAPQLLASGDIWAHRSVAVCLVVWSVAMFGLPAWLARWSRDDLARGIRLAAVGLAVAGAVTWMAGRENLAEARLEPHPVLWMVWGERVSYADLPPAEVMAPIGPMSPRWAPPVRPQDAVLIILESTPADALSAYAPEATGGRRLFEAFGDDIAVFEHVYAVAPYSTAAFVSALTGRTPAPSAAEAVQRYGHEPTLAEVLKAHGYETQMLVNGVSDPIMDAISSRGVDRSLDMYSTWESADRYARTIWGFDDRMLFDEARAVLTRRGPDAPPLLLVIHTNNPHHPYPAALVPGLTDSPDARTRHRQLVDHVLEQVTDFYGWLKATGRAESTAVFAFGDHGEAFGEHSSNYIHSKELFRENVHVPMLALHPERLGWPRRVPQLGSLDDVMPTLLDALGIALPARSGMSLFWEAPERVIFHVTHWGPGQVGFRDHQYSWMLSRTGRELLFDYRSDAGETRNLLHELPEVAAGFRRRLGPG